MKIEITQFPDGLRLNILGGDIFWPGTSDVF